jgi:Superinfection immunity protein
MSNLNGHKGELEQQLDGPMNELKAKWGRLAPPVRMGVIAAAVVVGLIVILKILPALVEGLGIGLFLMILFIPYWTPTIIAFVREHPSRGGILALNFFFGWTFVGWVVSLTWALSDNSARAGQQTVIVNTTVADTPTTAVTGTPPQQYRVGEIVNGHRFDGASWIPLPASPPPPPVVDPGSLRR